MVRGQPPRPEVRCARWRSSHRSPSPWRCARRRLARARVGPPALLRRRGPLRGASVINQGVATDELSEAAKMPRICADTTLNKIHCEAFARATYLVQRLSQRIDR